MSDHHPPSTGAASPDHHGQDPDPELRIRTIVRILVVLTLVTVAFAIVVWPLVRAFVGVRIDQDERRGLVVDATRPAGPLLQADPITELEQLRRQEDAILESYGWSDEAAGLARVPVRRAAQMVLEEGVGPLAVEGSGEPPETDDAASAGAEGGVEGAGARATGEAGVGDGAP